MEYVTLGKSGIRVSRMCFGGLTVGPLQANLPLQQGAEVMIEAFSRGVNFVDTAELYETYPYIAKAIKKTGKEIVVSSKSYAFDREGAIKSIEKARKELDRDVIDIFMLHEQESALTLRGHREALEYFMECKAKGIVRAVGVSMHHIAAVEAVCNMDGIDVIHPIINYRGLGIADGSLEQMLKSVKKAHDKGIGIYAMKPLGGGNFIGQFKQALDFVLSIPYIDSIALGMQSVEEVIANVSYFDGKPVEGEILDKLSKKQRNLHIDDWCEGCGNCIKACGQNALYMQDNKVRVKREKCILCGYCAAECPEFAIKVV